MNKKRTVRVKHGAADGSTAAMIKQCNLFLDVTEEQIKAEILPKGNLQHYAPGAQIFLQQDVVDFIGILLGGRVRLMQLFESGQESMIDLLQPPQVLAADLAFTRTRRSIYYAEAAEDTLLFQLPVSALLYPGQLSEGLRLEMLSRMLRIVSHDNMKRAYHLAILSRKGLRERIWTYLTMQADKRGTDVLTVPFSRDEMAEYLCVNRSALSHELSKMQQDGLLRFNRNRFELMRQ